MNPINLYHLADKAGKEAVANMDAPTPMVVVDPARRTLYHVADGVCGFAWIAFKGNTAFGRAMKKAGLARSHYPSGLCVWVSDYNQSMQRKEVYADAFAKTLRDNGVADAYAGSRMD